MAKFITRGENNQFGERYHTNRNCPIVLNVRTMDVTDSMLKHYGITQKCKLCEQHEAKLAKRAKEKTDNQKAVLISNSAKIVARQISRSELRRLCKELEIPFNLRTTKPRLAKDLCRVWVKSGAFDTIETIVLEAKNHWNERIQVGDKHKPALYRDMFATCEHVLKLLAGEHKDDKQIIL
jgi:hypothetical protein